MSRFFSALLALCLGALVHAETYELRNGDLIRRFELKDGRFRTLGWTDQATGRTLDVDSDEFAIRLSDGTVLTADDYEAKVNTWSKTKGPTGAPQDPSDLGQVDFTLRPKKTTNPLAPPLVIAMFCSDLGKLPKKPRGIPAGTILKAVEISWPECKPDHKVTVEVERFRTKAQSGRGGRGEPVVLDDAWILMPVDPTTLTRHTDGNQPSAYSHRFEKIGNHSFVDFERAELETNPQPGLVRALCFPPAQPSGPHLTTSSFVGVFAVPRGLTSEQAVIDYSRTKGSTQSYTHYNNWFDPAGKNLKGDNLPAIHRQFLDALKGSGIKVDGMVPDNGWQDRKSIWQPAPGAFPEGMKDLNKLSETLRAQGSSLGLWMAADGTTNDIGWGVKEGYARAQPNAYFKQYFAHYSLADIRYQLHLGYQIRALTEETKVSYIKFDFNHLSNVVPTDRHGHDAEFKGFCLSTYWANAAGVFINATNWTWHSPAWLNYADSVWLLAGDDGFNGNWPELAGRAQATTDRDVYFWRMWGDPSDRPWFPIANIMTHGIIRNAGGQMSYKTDLPRDWSDYVLMHYGRGTLLREWYLSPASVLPHEWQALIAIHRWTESRHADMINTCYVGGRPDEGAAYGFVGWSHDGTTGTLVARNPRAEAQTLRFGLDATTLFRGTPRKAWRGRIVYPYRQELAQGFESGAAGEITIPGYETVAIELEPGEARGPMFKLAPTARIEPGTRPLESKIKVAEFAAERRELLVMGYPALPQVFLDGKPATPTRRTKSRLNAYPGYARSGMPSEKARAWEMAGFDLASFGTAEVTVRFAGAEEATKAEAWLLTERGFGKQADKDTLSPLTFPGVLRHTAAVLRETELPAAPAPKVKLGAEDLRGVKSARLEGETFGVNAGYGEKTVTLNGRAVGQLPTGGDAWKAFGFDLKAETLTGFALRNVAGVSVPLNDDKFKVRNLRLVLTLADGRVVKVGPKAAFTSHADWAHFEGQAFEVDAAAKVRRTPPIPLDLE
ncbi:hypothetical protein LBMAG55_19050 [Verrucomicrobiota bacterium]|nr:hypothetical protein LBMAG55_19050 [Verrucomicrobiota bacterium]